MTIVVATVYYHITGLRKSVAMFTSIYLFELLYTLLLLFPAWIVCGILKIGEKISVFDNAHKINPFKLIGEIKNEVPI